MLTMNAADFTGNQALKVYLSISDSLAGMSSIIKIIENTTNLPFIIEHTFVIIII